jgi:two-component system cell cycle sensor histidine kinase/response regulator CckA
MRSRPAVDPRRSTPSRGCAETPVTVLVAEDEVGIRSPLRRLLSAQGYRVLDASDGPGALEVANRHSGRIHLLLTDILMPGMNGGELARRLLQVRPSMRVVFMSGFSDQAIQTNGILIPGATFLQKPFSVDELTCRLREALASE